MIRFKSFLAVLLIFNLSGAPLALAQGVPPGPSGVPIPTGNGFPTNTTGPQGPCLEKDPGIGLWTHAGDPSAATDPCHKLKLFRTAQRVQMISASIYTVALATCAKSCWSDHAGGLDWGKLCKYSGVAAQVSDMAGAAAIGNEGKNIMGTIMQSMGPMLGSQLDPGSSRAKEFKEAKEAQTASNNANDKAADADDAFADSQAKVDGLVDKDGSIAKLKSMNEEANKLQDVSTNDRNAANLARKSLQSSRCCTKITGRGDNANCAPSPTYQANSESCLSYDSAWLNAEKKAARSYEAYTAKLQDYNALAKDSPQGSKAIDDQNSARKGQARAQKSQETAQKKADKENGEADKSWDGPSCAAAGLNALQAGARIANYYTSKRLGDEAANEKRNMTGGEEVNTSTTSQPLQAGSGDKGNHGNTAEGQGNDPIRESGNVAQAFADGQGQAENSALAAQLPLIKNFENQTGVPFRTVAEKLAAGETPVQVAAQTAGGILGSDGLAVLSQIDSTVTPLAGQFSEQLETMEKETGLSQAAFAGGSDRGAGKSSGDGMPDLNAMMAAFMPKKPGMDGARGPAAAAAAAAAAKPSQEGLHPPTRSIFDVVDSRYQVLAQRFLDGGTVMSSQKAPSSLPSNPYLRKQ